MLEEEVWAGLGRAPGEGWDLGWATGGGEVVHLCTESCCKRARVPWWGSPRNAGQDSQKRLDSR